MNNKNTSHHLFNYIKNFFAKDTLWKLFSLVVAIIMWLVVMNIINPTEVKTFNAKVGLENMDYITKKGFVISNIDTLESMNISFKIEATRPALDELSKSENKNNIKAKVDLSKLDIKEDDVFPKNYSVVISPSLPTGVYAHNYDIATYYPTICQVEIDKVGEKTVPVEVKTYGEVADGYNLDAVESKVKEVVVSGPKSKINEVDCVVAVVDITGAKKSLSRECELFVVDGKGNKLNNFNVDYNSLNVNVIIKKEVSVNIDEPNLVGMLPEHLEFVSMDWTPKVIEGASLSENSLKSISIPAIDLSQISKNTTVDVDISDILEKAGLDSKSRHIKVDIKVKLKSAKRVDISKNDILISGLSPELEAVINEDTFVEIGGIDNVDIVTLSPLIDLTGYKSGVYDVKLKVNLPNNAILINDIYVNVTIKEKNVQQENVTENVSEEETKAEETEIEEEKAD